MRAVRAPSVDFPGSTLFLRLFLVVYAIMRAASVFKKYVIIEQHYVVLYRRRFICVGMKVYFEVLIFNNEFIHALGLRYKQDQRYLAASLFLHERYILMEQ